MQLDDEHVPPISLLAKLCADAVFLSKRESVASPSNHDNQNPWCLDQQLLLAEDIRTEINSLVIGPQFQRTYLVVVVLGGRFLGLVGVVCRGTSTRMKDFTAVA